MTQATATALEAASGEVELTSPVRAAARGDQAAFKELFDRYSAPVYNMVLRAMRNAQTAEDVCQEVWLKAYRELHRLEEPQAFPAWLYRIAARACVDAARKNRRLPATCELSEERMLSGGDDPERSALERERLRLTWEAMAVLPARQHLALFLREIERRSYREIAHALETSEAAVETLLFRARHGFAKAFEGLEAATMERCKHAQRTMATLMDGEATPVQKKAVDAHVEACRPCLSQLTRMQRATATYAALAPLPVPALLGERIFESLAAAGAGAGIAGGSGASAGFAKLLALGAAKVKIAAVSVVATGAVAATAMTTPVGDVVLPGPSAPSAPVEESASLSPARGSFEYDESALTREDVAVTPADSGTVAATVADEPPAAAEPALAVPDTAELTETVTSAVPDLDQTVGTTTQALTQSVDTILHEVEAAANHVVPLPPLPEVSDVVLPPVELPVEVPELPASLPTPGPLPQLP